MISYNINKADIVSKWLKKELNLMLEESRTGFICLLTQSNNVCCGLGLIKNAPCNEEDIGSLSYVALLTHKDISDLGKNFATHTQNRGWFDFGVNCRKKMKALMDWEEDFGQINKEQGISGMNHEKFLTDIKMSGQQAAICHSNAEKAKAHVKKVSSSNLMLEKEWDKWESKFENQLSMHGIYGVPLLYVICKVEEPDANTNFETFIKECIAKCPLKGPKFGGFQDCSPDDCVKHHW